MLQHIKCQVLGGCDWSLLIYDSHGLVEDWQHSSLEVLLIWQLLELFPFIYSCFLSLLCSFLFFLFSNSSLNPINFIISGLFSDFNLLDEVVWLQNSSMWLYLYSVLVDEFLVVDDFLCNNITDIYDAILASIYRKNKYYYKL